jgi:hypothetical protein
MIYRNGISFLYVYSQEQEIGRWRVLSSRLWIMMAESSIDGTQGNPALLVVDR